MDQRVPRKNGPPTAAEAARLKSYIDDLNQDIEYLSIRMEKENKQISLSSQAIQNLEATLLLGRDAAKTHEKATRKLTRTRDKIKVIRDRAVAPIAMTDEPSSSALYTRIRGWITDQNTGRFFEMEASIETMKQESRALQDMVRELELELDGWITTNNFASSTLDNLSKAHKEAAKNLELSRGQLSSIWMVPSEVWTRIFQLKIDEDIEEHFSETTLMPLKASTFSLSWVCRSWRYMIHNEPRLWAVIGIRPGNMWSTAELDRFSFFLERAKGFPITFMINLAQHRLTRSTVLDHDVVSGRPYSLHIDMPEDNSQAINRLELIPFLQPFSLTISSRLPLHGNVFTSLPKFKTIQALTIVNDYPQNIPIFDISTTLPELLFLTLKFKRLPENFDITPFLSPQLKGLYISHNGQAQVLEVSATIKLPQLRVLGLTSSDSHIMCKLVCKSLHRLVLYGHTDIYHTQMKETQDTSNAYHQLMTLEFHDWQKPIDISTSFGAITTLCNMSRQIPSLHSVAFVRSFVHGDELVRQAKTAKTVEGGALKFIKEIILDSTTGITQPQCVKLESYGLYGSQRINMGSPVPVGPSEYPIQEGP